MLPVKNSCYKEPELEVADYQCLGKHSCGRVWFALLFGEFEGTDFPFQSGQPGRAGYVL